MRLWCAARWPAAEHLPGEFRPTGHRPGPAAIAVTRVQGRGTPFPLSRPQEIKPAASQGAGRCCCQPAGAGWRRAFLRAGRRTRRWSILRRRIACARRRGWREPRRSAPRGFPGRATWHGNRISVHRPSTRRPELQLVAHGRSCHSGWTSRALKRPALSRRSQEHQPPRSQPIWTSHGQTSSGGASIVTAAVAALVPPGTSSAPGYGPASRMTRRWEPEGHGKWLTSTAWT